MENIKTWANTHSWVKIAVYLLTFLFSRSGFCPILSALAVTHKSISLDVDWFLQLSVPLLGI